MYILTRRSLRLTSTALLLAGFSVAQAQPADVPWSEVGGGVNGPVTAVLHGGGDTLVVVGAFTMAGGVAANHVALWDGTAFSAMGGGVNGTINAAAMVGGVPYIGGASLSSNYNDIAHWDGDQWIYGNAFSGNYPQINTLFTHNDTLYAGGITSGFAGSDDHVMRLVNGNWEPVGSTLNNLVRCLGWHNGQIVAGGDFTALQNGGGTNLNHVAVLTGGDWGPLGTGLADPVNTLLDMGGTLYAGGSIRSGGMGHFGLARFPFGASAWELLMPGSSSYVTVSSPDNPSVNTLYSDGTHLYIGGKFPLNVGGVTGAHVARFNGSANAFTPLASFNAPVTALASTSSLGLIAGGDFTMDGSTSMNYLAHTDQATTIPTIHEAADLRLFPSPATDRLTITGDPDMNGHVEVFSMDGRSLTGPRPMRQGRAVLDVSALPPGAYLLRTDGNGQRHTRRFIKE
jgi:hypothetical protein